MITIKWQEKEFKKALLIYAKESKTKTLAKDLEKMVFQIFKWIIKDTPVDTGDAKGSWNLTKMGELLWKINNERPYIRILEFGGYRGQGEKTRSGVSGWTRNYVSKQAPIGMLRKNIFRAAEFLKRGKWLK